MGYHVTMEVNLVIPGAGGNRANCLDAINAMFDGPGKFAWVDNGHSLTLPEAFERFRYKSREQDGGLDLYVTDFIGEKWGDDASLYGVIAPYVRSGGTIRVLGEDGDRYLYDFIGGGVSETITSTGDDEALTFIGFSQRNRRRCEHPEGFGHALSSWSLSDWMTATMGELGEAANIAKKLNRYRDGIKGNKEGEEELRAALASELSDTFIYLDLMCQAAGINLAEAVQRTFEAKSKEIGYRE